ncbi:unnamed protein product [Anisakis simplex]|uniref:Membrane-bound O-acyltransferase domain-containing protein 5 n=1 Tax=Anisakis simplex TaxID=6269 RepID=A0A158PNL8_ANISI|nr:unnamed protein product [Anisakis simplex]
MPGKHTFYDGSSLLQPLANATGIDVAKANLVVCQFISLPIAFLHYKYFAANRVSRNVRLAFPPFVGIIFCYFCYGNAIKHLVSCIGISYAIMHLSPAEYVHKCVFLFSMGYLGFIHWYRWYVLTSYTIDITGPMMVFVQKLTTIAFSLHDGRVKKDEELNDVQRRQALSSVPPLLEFLSYTFHFQTILTGPLCFFTDYMEWIDGTNAIGKDGKIESQWKAVITKLLQVILFAFVIVQFGSQLYPERLAEPEVMAWHWFPWWMMLYVMMVFQRVQYYFAWILADAICNVSGFGFNGYDKNGKPRWDLMSNVDVIGVEMATNFKETLDSWNCCTMHWLRRVAYDRVAERYRTVATYLLSAFWHGFFPGYYLTFLGGALFTMANRSIRRSLRHHFQGSAFSKRFYDVLTFLTTKVALAYVTFPFVTLHLNPGLFVYRSVYFCVHILALLSIVVLPIVMPPPPRAKKSVKKTETEMANENGGLKKVE